MHHIETIHASVGTPPRPRWVALATLAGALLVGGTAFADADVATLDSLFAARDSKASENATAVDDAMKASPTSYDVLWRAARWHCWVADGLRGSAHEKRQSEAEACMDLGKKAVAAKPNGVEGNYYAANGSGQYAQEIGILKALGKGMEGVFNGFIDKAMQIDPSFEAGAAYVVKGRYYYELPWPKRSYSKSEEMYRKALAVQPQNVRAHVYMAETLLDDGDAKGAKAQLDEALNHKVGAYDPPEEERAMKLAAQLKPKVDKELK